MEEVSHEREGPNIPIANKALYKELKDLFDCRICGKLLMNPKMCALCECVFCARCLEDYISRNKDCPNRCLISCNETPDSTSVSTSNLLVNLVKDVSLGNRNYLNKLKLECKYGCIVPFLDYYSHSAKCQEDHSDDVKCWNCNKTTKAYKMKEQTEDKIKGLFEDNLSLGAEIKGFLSGLHKTENTKTDIVMLLKYFEKKVIKEKEIYEFKKVLKEKEAIKRAIEILEEKLNRGMTIKEIKQKLNFLQQDLKEIESNMVDFCTESQNLADLFVLKKEEDKEIENDCVDSRKLQNKDLLGTYLFRRRIVDNPFEPLKDNYIKDFRKNIGCVLVMNASNRSYIILGSFDGQIYVCTLDYFNVLHTLMGHYGEVKCLTSIKVQQNFLVASGSSDNTVKLWNIETGHLINSLKGHSGQVNCIDSFNLNNQQVIMSGGDDKSIKIWNPKSGMIIKSLTGHDHFVSCLCPSLASNLKSCKAAIFSGSWDKTIKLWNISTGAELKTLKGHETPIVCLNSVAYKNHTFLISSGDDGLTKIWDIDYGTIIREINVAKSRLMKVITLKTEPYILLSTNNDSFYIFSIEGKDPIYFNNANNLYIDTLIDEKTIKLAIVDSGSVRLLSCRLEE